MTHLEADDLCLRVGNLALGVALVGGMIASRGSQPYAWAEVLQRLEESDVKAIADTVAPDGYVHASVLSSITVSIDDLEEDDRDRTGSWPSSPVAALSRASPAC